MTLTRRSFIAGLVSLAGLLAWPWKRQSAPIYQVPEGTTMWEHDSARAWREGAKFEPQPRDIWAEGDYVPSLEEYQQVDSELAELNGAKNNMVELMLETAEKWGQRKPETLFLTVHPSNVEFVQKHFPGVIVQATRKIS